MDQLPKDKPAYGYTRDGEFFIHRALLGNPDGEDVVFVAEFTSWMARDAHKKGDWYVYRTEDDMDKKRFGAFDRMKVHYFFVVGDAHVPHHLLKDSPELVPDCDLGGYAKVGTTFCTYPVKEAPF